LLQWQSKGTREIEIDWLRKTWGLETKYKALKDLKKWVIEPAMKDINKHSNLWVKFGQRKAGRRVVEFKFQFGLKKPGQAPKKLTQKQAEALARTGESYKNLYERLKYEGYQLDIKKFS
jgi:plasmid replication initiation protein